MDDVVRGSASSVASSSSSTNTTEYGRGIHQYGHSVHVSDPNPYGKAEHVEKPRVPAAEAGYGKLSFAGNSLAPSMYEVGARRANAVKTMDNPLLPVTPADVRVGGEMQTAVNQEG